MGLFDMFKSKEERDKDEIKKSFFILAQKFNCGPTQVADFFIKSLETQDFSMIEIEQSIVHWKNKRIEEAEGFNMAPENTPASLMELWTKEYRDKQLQDSENSNNGAQTTAKRLLHLAKESIGLLKDIETIARELGPDGDNIRTISNKGEVEALLFNSNYILNLYRVKIKENAEDVQKKYMKLLEMEIESMINTNELNDFHDFLNNRMSLYSQELNRLNSQGGLPITLYNTFMLFPMKDHFVNSAPNVVELTIFHNQFKEMINTIRQGVQLIAIVG